MHLSKLYSRANGAGECLLSRKLKSCDNIPPAMSCITDNDNFTAVCTNPAVIETAFNQYLENEGPIDDEPLNEYVYMYKLLWFYSENDVEREVCCCSVLELPK